MLLYAGCPIFTAGWSAGSNSLPLIIGLICFHSAALTARGSCYSTEAHGHSATCAHTSTCMHAHCKKKKRRVGPTVFCCHACWYCVVLICHDNKHVYFFSDFSRDKQTVYNSFSHHMYIYILHTYTYDATQRLLQWKSTQHYRQRRQQASQETFCQTTQSASALGNQHQCSP